MSPYSAIKVNPSPNPCSEGAAREVNQVEPADDSWSP